MWFLHPEGRLVDGRDANEWTSRHRELLLRALSDDLGRLRDFVLIIPLLVVVLVILVFFFVLVAICGSRDVLFVIQEVVGIFQREFRL